MQHRIKTGDIVRAFRNIPQWSKVTGDMVRKAERNGQLRAIRSPFSDKSGLFYDPESIREFIEAQVQAMEITEEGAALVLGDLGINFKQLRLVQIRA